MDSKLSLILLLFFRVFQLTNSKGFDVNPTLVLSDPEAVCLTGKPASYYFVQGFGKGVNNWLVFLLGGGWCATPESCINITKDPETYSFEYILSSNQEENPDFFNWNKAVINYCDGSSFTGDSQTIYNGTKLYFRGARIYNAVMQELLHKGMGMAQNALLAGGSAGGVAATLHCDGFRNLLPYAFRVKCFSDAGYFFPSIKFKDQHEKFTTYFQGLITLHGSINSLPKSCTSKLSPYLCFFAQNVHQDIKTPIFFLMSAFDSIQGAFTFPDNQAIKNCVYSCNCASDNIKILQDLRLEFLTVLPKQRSCSSRGILITSPMSHGQSLNCNWDSDMVIKGSDEKISKIFGDWYFNERVVYIIDKYQYPCPSNYCSAVLN